MKTVILIEDVVRSLNKKDKVYGKKGDKVKVIAISGSVLIVEGKERFSVRVEIVKNADGTRII